MNRRHFLISTAAASLPAAAQEEPQTFVYKRDGACEIKADVHGVAATGRNPVAVWLHGGALISGTRRFAPNARVLRSLRTAGFTVVSLDYRLAPETKLPEIIEDVRDAFSWIRSSADKFRIDPDRLVVSGGSAGGYLTLMTGFAIRPRPKALVSWWGYGDIVGPWYSQPDPFYLRQPKVTREEALAAVGTTPISEPPPGNKRGRFYLYCRQQGLWPKEVAGRDPATNDRWFAQYCPIRNVTREYPPTMLVHGTADTDVPYEQSKIMAGRLAQAGVEHQLVTVPDGDHGLGNVAAEKLEQLYSDAAAFLRKRV
jgi:acetyl esterase/lipase